MLRQKTLLWCIPLLTLSDGWCLSLGKKDKYENNVKFITWVTWKRIDKWHYAEDISGPGRAHYSGDRVFIYLNMKNEFIRCIIIMYHLITGWVTNIVSQGKILILFYNFFFPHIWMGGLFKSYEHMISDEVSKLEIQILLLLFIQGHICMANSYVLFNSSVWINSTVN